ncbi:MAG TPA: thermonuclease family protein [Devosia sp.]|nr:thermonuclease family protein [Devosia sp.]
MSIIRFDPKHRRRPDRPRPRKGKRDVLTPALAGIALFAVCSLGWVAVDQGTPASSNGVALVADRTPAGERRVDFGMCGRHRFTCVVDGDTIWLDGVNLRLQSYDTPEPYNDICGGAAEVALAKRASDRLLQLLDGNSFAVETAGTDRYGRTLATLRIGGRDVGDILIEEGLARRWPDGKEFWC